MALNRYRGDGLPPDRDKKKRYPYLADSRLVQVVNMALTLQRPLLVKGDPGCGKTQLAYSIAHELGLELFPWYVKSTSRARDGLYDIDAIQRLQDAQMQKPEAQDILNYRRWGPLGSAFLSEHESVVLIDEIDKADIDFPNDLLRELEEKKIEIEELDEADPRRLLSAKSSPIIIVTSNDEKELPDAFLRRCLFYFITFPPKPKLIDIVEVNFAVRKNNVKLDSHVVDAAVDRLLDLRNVTGLRKLPSTSELIDWVHVLHAWKTSAKTLRESKTLSGLPYLEVLFKHQQDLQELERQAREQAR